MKHFLTLFLSLLIYSISAQDTLQVMQYNLLNYGNYYGDCNTSTNNVSSKNVHLREIIQYVQPDIFTVNELSDNTIYHQMILDQVLNINGENKYRKAVSFNFADSYIVNQMFYNSEKLALYHQDVVIASYRDIDVYTLYYKAGDLAQTHDTIFLTCFVGHLKAGNTDSDENSRAGMVANAISYIRSHDLSDNLLFMGDFNLYSSSEQAYINLTYTYNGERYFYDPVNREGSWNNNASFQDVHTQSTHSDYADCFSSGGLDDRFDFIMASSSVLNGTDGVQMLIDTYRALGNDGQHFNMNITDAPVNNSAPEEVINALFNMSDHLPVLAQLKIDGALGIQEQNQNITAIKFPNPSTANLSFEVSLEEASDIQIQIFDLFGRNHLSKSFLKQNMFVSGQIDLQNVAQGTYLFVVSDAFGNRNSRKFFLKK